MSPEKLPLMEKKEYDELIKNQYICRISYSGADYPQIKPFLYVFDGDYIYILATKYGEKMKYLMDNPKVTVEIERYSEDFSDYEFVTLSGRLVKVEDEQTSKKIRDEFVDMIQRRSLSKNVMVALGHSKEDPVEAISKEARSHVFKLVDVEKIVGLSRGE